MAFRGAPEPGGRLIDSDCMLFRNANVILPDKTLWHHSVLVQGKYIKEIGAHINPSLDENVIDATGLYLTPGFIDIHIHLGYLAPEYTFSEELSLSAKCLPANGTTRYLPTLVSALQGFLPDQFQAIREVLSGNYSGAQPIGVHLEGPYVAEGAIGGFTHDQIATPERFSIQPILDEGRDLIRIVMVAPELPGALAVIEDLRQRGIVAAMGHTLADLNAYDAARKAGATHCTHTYNNRRTFPESTTGGRAFNLDDLAVADDEVTCELICDGTHVKPVWVKTIYRTKGPAGISLITDSFLCGQRGHEGAVFRVSAGKEIMIHGGVGRDTHGGLAGSVVTQDVAVRKFMSLGGASLEQAIHSVTLSPARVVGLDHELGSIEPGKVADIVLLRDDLTPVFTCVNGAVAYNLLGHSLGHALSADDPR